MEKILEDLGLTGSEIKVYLALLKIGESKKFELVKEAKISASKIYDVTSSLEEKGLVSIILKNKIKHFKAAPPKTILDLLENQKEDLNKKQIALKDSLPKFNKLINSRKNIEKVEMFTGWEGIKTIYSIILSELEKGDEDLVIGASSGINNVRTQRFYANINKKLRQKGIKLSILFGKDHKKYAKEVSKQGGLKYSKEKYLPFSFPAELNIFKESVAIIILTEEPFGIIVRNNEFSQSSKAYFHSLWKIAED